MENKGVNLQVSDTIISDIVQQKIEMEIIKAMDSDKDALIKEIVSKTINQKVDSEGKVSNYSSSNKYNLIDLLFKNKLQQLTSNILVEYVESKQKNIREEIENQLVKNKKELARGLIKGLIESSKSKWTFKVDIQLPQEE